MPGLTPARLLAPVALVVCALALIIVLSSGGGDSSSSSSSGGGGDAKPKATATATATAKPKAADSGSDSGTKTYTVKPGDSPSSIAAAEGVSTDALLEANPDADPTALSVGDKLKVPEG